MSGETVTFKKEDLADLVEAVARRVAAAVGHQAALPRLYAFPEDIQTILGGPERVATATIRGWKTAGYLKTIKVGARAYVRPEDFDWFLANHKKLMAACPRSRGRRFDERRAA